MNDPYLDDLVRARAATTIQRDELKALLDTNKRNGAKPTVEQSYRLGFYNRLIAWHTKEISYYQQAVKRNQK